MKNNKGVTLVSVVIIVIALVIIASVSIISGLDILGNSKESKIEENLAAVKTVVNQISIKQSTAGVFTPAIGTIYGKPATEVLSGDAAILSDWYILDEESLEQMGVEYIEEKYLVNYNDNEVYRMSEYEKDASILD